MPSLNCHHCSNPFERNGIRGSRPKYCSRKCAYAASRIQQKALECGRGPCAVDGCRQPVTRVKHQMCERHFYRMRRTGCTDVKLIKGRYHHKGGYVRILAHGHPMADKNGMAFEHRIVLYDQHEGRCPGCFWCGCPLEWNETHSDHLNEIKTDNSPGNLEVSCGPCNRIRGAMKPFLHKLSSGSFDAFIKAAKAFRSAAS